MRRETLIAISVLGLLSLSGGKGSDERMSQLADNSATAEAIPESTKEVYEPFTGPLPMAVRRYCRDTTINGRRECPVESEKHQ